ncbi:pre-mRNA-splicing factor 38B-like isoform X1 [Teleopsis dalmanni]|uniref:pre-mRNA-splicing factor 38B-like isoform X1 n=1 Tax=Teleopsis dalmanni TaxID=139649 RepID=UPI0018CE8618|nr:pre-mRNA-splicing factor 38B-like isoform X1 [Teleopsis dalmanni]XP_037935199.1 pre-mRNA-splicing factor 38B-like isoform X1 [Teleopsis dalmanni]
MDEATSTKKVGKQHNTLPLWGNEASMNLNPLILANIQGSSYFKVHLFKLKTYHEVVDEIYYQVKHMEPWERGSRKTSGQTGMCGGVRGVGAGGIVSTAYCLLYKLYTLRLTRKQVNGLLNHTDSPYIRALGFMYLRYTQPPADLYDWYEDYLQDEEEIDVKAGGGQMITIGQMVYQFLTKIDWFSTLFPRIPVPIQKQIEKKLELYCRTNQITLHQLSTGRGVAAASQDNSYNDDSYNRRGGAVSGRDINSERDYPPLTNYRTEHDDRDRGRGRERERDYYQTASSSSYRRHEYSSPAKERERRSSREREKHHEKSKKKRKHKHHSRSRSNSQSHSRHERKHERERSGHTKSRDDYEERRYR